MSNTKTIAKNAGWYGLENLVNIFITMFTSIVIARTLGPAKMGYIIYVVWIASVADRLGGLGIPATMRKYMAEFLGMRDRGTARYVYFRTLRTQAGLAVVITAAIVAWILRDANAEYRWAAVLVALSIWPSMVNSISSQANIASEQLGANLPASFVSILIYFAAILITVTMKWGVLGVAGSMLAMRLVDFAVRSAPTVKRILSWERTHARPAGLERRMISFAWQSVTATFVALIVWDRSEFFLLKHFCSDIRQVAFYSVAFNMAERLLLSASIFGTAIGATIFAQYGRDRSRLPDIAASAFRYLTLTSIPLHIVASALAGPALLLLYGRQYSGALAVATLAPVLCMPKAFLEPARNLLQSAEQQGIVIFATAIAGAIDVAVAWLLVAAHGAVGACIGSGVAQMAAIAMLWAADIYLFKVKLPWGLLGKIVLISVLASLSAHYVSAQMTPLWALLCGGSAALIVFAALAYFMRVFEPQDSERCKILTGMLPDRLAGSVNFLLGLMVRRPLNSVTVSSYD